MGTIFRIFRDDIKSIVKHVFVFVIVIALIVLPALYAWVNIYANNNPYVNTGNIAVAVASKDHGIQREDGSYVNASREVMDEMRDNDKIGWQFLDSADDAVEGVRAGRFYAAVVFEDDFTYNMYNLKEALLSEEASLTYYSNTKKSAIGAKITDSAAESLLDSINTKYLEAIFDQVFEDSNELSETLDPGDAVEEGLKQLSETRDALHDFNAAIDLFSASSDDISDSLKTAEKDLDQAKKSSDADIAKAGQAIREAKTAANALKKNLSKNASRLDRALTDLQKTIEAIGSTTDEDKIRELAKKAEQEAETVLAILKDMRSLIPVSSKSSAVQILSDTIDIMILNTEEIIQILKEDPAGSVKEAADAVTSLASLHDDALVPGINRLASDIKRAVKVAKPLLSAADGMLGNIDPMLNSADKTVTGLDTTLLRLQTVLSQLEQQLDDIIAQVESTDEEEQLGVMTKLLGGNPGEYSKFFSSLVRVNSHEVYAVKSYGAAMTPFYSVLAIWVGGVVLAALLRTNVTRRRYPRITESQAFFGRFLIFALLGQLQAAVIVLGDIFLLHVEPVHPWLMWVTAAVTGLVFMMINYAAVLSFGDIGKAMVVVVMILQISGSSGSFPIEILPVIYGKIFKFFPFPYAINAMREALCGTYGTDIIIYLAQLMVFFVAGLLVGLLVRRPFIGVNRFVNEKLEETEVL